MKKSVILSGFIILIVNGFLNAQALTISDLEEDKIYFVNYKRQYERPTYNYGPILTRERIGPGQSMVEIPKIIVETETVYEWGVEIFLWKNQSKDKTISNIKSDVNRSNLTEDFNDADFRFQRSSNFKPRNEYSKFDLRPATNEEKYWLEICIQEDKFIPKHEALKRTKNRGEVKSEAIHLSTNDRLQPGFKGRKDGFGFSGVSFNYQFVNCGGEVQMGVKVYTKHEYKVNGQTYNRGLTINGYAFEGELYPTFTVDANQVEILEVEADLYFGSVRLGKVNLDNIVGNFAGCFGETFLVIEQLGLDPNKKEYLENLDKFELKRIRVLRGDVKVSEKKRQEIHHNFKYDEWGNLRNSNNKPKEKTKQKYDAFGNPIKSDSKPASSNSQGNNKPKYDAFGNPIKN